MRKTTSKNLKTAHLLSSASAAAVAAITAVWSTASADEVIVTATRRAESVQDIPLNISAIGSEQIEEQGLTELSDLLAYVPGINIVDRGGRQGNPIIVRGLNVDPLGSGDGNNDGGGTVATYLGEIPVYVDLKLNDLERVEVLLGPQGTLYGAGTLGGAIRYIPKRPDFDTDSFQVRLQGSSVSHSSSLSSDTGFTINKGLTDNFALRGSLDYVHDSGYIDYVNVVREIGVSNPDPDFSDPVDVNRNLRTVRDANGEDVLSARIAARWAPADWLDGTLTYYYQNSEIEGRSQSHFRDIVPGVGRYEAAYRVEEPNEITNDLLALEWTADLGFAELTSATGYSTYEEDGQRDQTTLLITLEYSYELFPSFTAFTSEVGKERRLNQELRLVSKHEGPFQWIVGGFFNDFDLWGSSSEFTPNYVPYVNQPALDFGLADRPDALEYFSTDYQNLTELAAFGEVSYKLFDRLTLTFGGRYYDYELKAVSTVDFPLFDGGFVPLSLDEIKDQAFDPDLFQADSGFLFKANASLEVTDDLLVYATVSEGYRIGGSNGLGECEMFDPMAPATQGACALAPGQVFFPGGPGNVSTRDERQYAPDQTRNYELGFKSSWLDGAFVLNGAFFYVDWIDPQVSSATVNANIPITVNGDGARSIGTEISASLQPTDNLSFRGSFSYTDSELTAPVPDLVRTITPPGFASTFEDGEDGDRLPGAPKTQFSLFGSYDKPLSDGSHVVLNASYAWQGDVLTRAGGRGSSYTLDSYGVANLSLSFQTDKWAATLFATNLLDKYAETGAVSTPLYSQSVSDFEGGTHYVRGFSTHILRPRTVGIRFTYDFMSN